MKPLFLTLLCSSLVGGGLFAQGPDDPGGTTGDIRATEGLGANGEGGFGAVVNAGRPLEPKKHFEQRATGLVEVTRLSNGTVSERKVPMEEARRLRKEKKVPRIRANNLCSGRAFVQPRRLAVGQTGTLKVLVQLGGKAVALPGSGIVLSLNNSPGLKFGKPVLRPTTSRPRKSGKFLGQRVYDDHLIFEVPVTVEQDTKSPQKIGVSGLCDLELYDGQTGNLIGDYTAEVGGLLPVGAPLPSFKLNSVARPRAASEDAASTPTPESSPEVSKKSAKAVGSSSDTAAGGASAPMQGGERDAEAVPAEGAPEGYGVGEESDNFLLIGGGAVGLILILLLVFRRR